MIKKGDKIVCKAKNGLNITIGKTYEVQEVEEELELVLLLNDMGRKAYHSKACFELVTEEETDDSYDAIIPEHYREGQIDLIESWYLTYPFNEFRAIMQAYAQRYFMRKKFNRVEDMEKGLYVMQRLKEYEEKELEKEKE